MNARKHWDVELVEAVGRLIIPRYRSVGYINPRRSMRRSSMRPGRRQ